MDVEVNRIPRFQLYNPLNCYEVQDILKMIQETGVVKIEDPKFKGIPEK